MMQGPQRSPQENPYQNGVFGKMPAASQEEQTGRGMFSGVLQEAVEKSETPDFEPYEKPEAGGERVSEPVMADSEQDAEIVLEAAKEALKQEDCELESVASEENEKESMQAENPELEKTDGEPQEEISADTNAEDETK